MQFVLRTGTAPPSPPDGPFWNHPALAPAMAADAQGWSNFGGDKAWPAPQTDWEKLTGTGWPPPRGFDAQPFTATTEGAKVRLRSPVDPAYGLTIERVLSLDPVRPLLTIVTTYRKRVGSPVRVGVWTITQLASPQRLFVRLPPRSIFAHGHESLLPTLPKDLKVEGALLSMTADPLQKTMIASDGAALLWLGAGPSLRIETGGPAVDEPPGAWPNHGAHSQIYTSPTEGQRYVELELLGPLATLRPGQATSMTSRYLLIPRVEADPEREAKRIFETANAQRRRWRAHAESPPRPTAP
jgi:hypothetical protein